MQKTSTPPDVARFVGADVFVLQSASERNLSFDPTAGSCLLVSEACFRPIAVGEIVRHTGGSLAVAWKEPGRPEDAAPVRRRKIVTFAVERPIPVRARHLYGDSVTVFGFAREAEFFAVLCQNAELDQWFSVQQKAMKLGVHVSADVATDAGLAQAVGRRLVLSTSDLIDAYQDAETAAGRIRRFGDAVDRLRDALRSMCPDLFNQGSAASAMSSLTLSPVAAVDGVTLKMPFDLQFLSASPAYTLHESIVDVLAASIRDDFAAAGKKGGA